jgi:hypothetical protein
MSEQLPIGYVTITETDTDGKVIYGIFSTENEALEFGSKLINFEAYPIYAPALH